ncbi:apolipoprotein N-acyltransferase [Balneolales bacterium ANBcel1]|nr:apolipoprotein N-acyltransferase [Balneolales bacterium ANBcel1]
MSALSVFWNHKWVASGTAGLLLGLSLSPFPFPFSVLAIAGFVWLFRLTDLTRSAREMAYVAYPGLVLWNLITTYWLMFATVPGGIAAILANSAIMTLPLMVIWHLRHTPVSRYFTALAVPAIWLTYEFLHFRWDLSWPWLSLGNSFATAPWLVQYIAFTGLLGITYWIVLSAWMIYRKFPLAAILAVLLLPPAGSLVRYAVHDPQPSATVEVAVLQPNYDSYLHLAGYPNPIEPLQELLEYSDEIVSPSTQAVFWPENAIMALIRQNYPGEADRIIQRYVREWDAPLVAGSSFLRRYPDGEAPPVTRGEYGGRPFNIYNSALAFYPDQSMEFYKKAKLVPMVERIPFVNTLSRMDYFGWIDWSQAAMFGKGTSPDLFDVNGILVPALICYDSVYPDWARTFVRNGAGFLMVITNDGWWGNTSGHIQHFEFARLRAVETGRTVLRSANNGLSGVILANGDVAVKTEYWTRDRFTYDVPVYEHQTFYVRHGDWIGRPGLLLFLAALVAIRRIRRN